MEFLWERKAGETWERSNGAALIEKYIHFVRFQGVGRDSSYRYVSTEAEENHKGRHKIQMVSRQTDSKSKSSF